MKESNSSKSPPLQGIGSPEELKQLPAENLTSLAETIRHELIDNLSRTGGHLGPNLGVVELTIALHRVFDSPSDKFLFDVFEVVAGVGISKTNGTTFKVLSTDVRGHDHDGVSEIDGAIESVGDATFFHHL